MPYSITTRDGITLNNIPDDVAPDSAELKARVQQIREGSGEIRGDSINGKSRQQLEAEASTLSQPEGAGTRFGLGMAEPVVGLGQLASRGLAAVGSGIRAVAGDNAASRYLEGLPAQNDRAAMDLASDQEVAARGLEGMDVARLGGNILTLAPTAMVGGVPATIGGLARAGATAGAIGGAAMPTAGGEGYAADKVLQVGVGAALGGVAGPAVQRTVQGLGAGVASIVNAVRERVSPTATPQQIQVTINQTLQNAGIDLSTLPQSFMDDVTRQVRSAMATGGPMDEQALVNRATFESLGIQPTRGQVTQNPSQYGRELFLREAPGGEDLATQYRNSLQLLNQRLGDVQAGAAAPVRNVEAGRQAMNVLQQADNRGNALVNALYGAARQSAGLDTPLDGARFSQNVINRMEQQMVGDKLPSNFTAVLNQLATGARDLDIRTGEQIMRAVNQRLVNTSDRVERAALQTFKDGLQDAIDSAGSATGQQAAQAFRSARGAAAQRFNIQEAIPALRATVNGEVAPDDFMRKFVYGAKVDELQQLGRFVQQASPQTWQQIRGQVLGDLRNAASPSGQAQDWSSAGFNRALRSLDQSGKLELLFTRPEIQRLQAISRAGDLVTKGPPGVSRTGLSGAAKAVGMMTDLVGRIPGLGRVSGLAQAASQRGANTLQANVALAPAPVAQNGLQSLVPPQVANRLGALAGPAALPFTQGIGN